MRNTARTMRDIAAVIKQMPDYFGSKDAGIGSNAWAVSGALTATGKPLLANDPHLSPTMPSIWTQVGLHCRARNDACTFDVAGWSFSGFPGVIIGHNERVGWGFTNLGPDVSDLVLEDVQGNQVRLDGTLHPLTIVNETIKVAGGADVYWQARSTSHGPLISDVSKTYARAGAS
jgi:penicillin amidase